MKKIAALLLASIALCTTLVAHADDGRRTLTVTGESTVKVKNEEAVLRLGVTTRDLHAKEAAETNTKIMNKVKKAIATTGIAPDKIETQDYNLSQVSERHGENNYIRKYEASHRLKIIVNEMESAGVLLDAAVKAGANDVDSVEFLPKDTEKYKDEALRKAIQNAKKKAEIMAAAVGKQVVNVVSISEGHMNMIPFYENRSKMLYAVDESVGGAVPLSGGESTIEATVTIVFEIA